MAYVLEPELGLYEEKTHTFSQILSILVKYFQMKILTHAKDKEQTLSKC
jgi:hypothetical protein